MEGALHPFSAVGAKDRDIVTVESAPQAADENEGVGRSLDDLP